MWPQNVSRQVPDYIRISSSETSSVISPENVCNNAAPESSISSSKNVRLLVVVCSAVENAKERDTIRDSWASPSLTPDSVKVVFLVGKSNNFSVESDIMAEADKFGDIIQEDFLDSYANLTVKSLMMLRWFTRTCDTTPYVLKTDDDVYINLNQLDLLVSATSRQERVSSGGGDLLMGTLICGATPIRDPYNKWYAPAYMYHSRVYPNYLSGTAYLMSNSVARKLFEVAMITPMFHLEDIYVTGILAKAAGVRPEDHVTFSYLKRTLSRCLYSQIVSSHHLSHLEMMNMAKQLMKDQKCKRLRKKQIRPYGPGKCKW